MKHSLCCFLLLHFFVAPAQTSMFREGSEHLGISGAAPSKPLTDLRWTFQSSGPIRATVCTDDQNLYFGTAKGVFYCLDKKNGNVKWTASTGAAVHSSAAVDDRAVYFSNNRQTVFSLDKQSGKINWQVHFPGSKTYDWGFDYFYSSPTLVNGQLLIGIKDGFVYNLNAATGKINWKFKTDGIVRSTPAVKDGVVFFGDTEGILYAVDLATANERWRFRTEGNGLKNEDYGFDRRAIISSPAVTEDKVIFGGRDGFLYAVDRTTGRERWRVNHNVSWVISSPAVKDSFVVTGTSDGHFVQAVNLASGKEIWRYKTAGIVWSSPLICGNKVYIGSNEGILYCLDLHTGQRLAFFQTGGKLWSSPRISDSLLFIGNDKGALYALQQERYSHPQSMHSKKLVFYEPDISGYAKKSVELKTKEFLNSTGFETIDSKKLENWLLRSDSAAGSVIVFATNYFPAETLKGNRHSPLRQYLEAGGRIVLLGLNPAIYVRDAETKAITNFDFSNVDSIFGIHYPFNDLRSMTGIQPAFATEAGKQWGLNDFWSGFMPLQPAQVDVVLGLDENGFASAWIKQFGGHANTGLIQLWMDQENEPDPSFILRVATHGLD